MLYGILFFIAALVVIIGSKRFAAKLEEMDNKHLKNRWWWFLGVLVFLIAAVFLPAQFAIVRGLLVVLAAFDAMVFFEMNRSFFNRGFEIQNRMNQRRIAELEAKKQAAK